MKIGYYGGAAAMLGGSSDGGSERYTFHDISLPAVELEDVLAVNVSTVVSNIS